MCDFFEIWCLLCWGEMEVGSFMQDCLSARPVYMRETELTDRVFAVCCALDQCSSGDLNISSCSFILAKFENDLFADDPDPGHIHPVLSQHLLHPCTITSYIAIENNARSSFRKCIRLICPFPSRSFGQAGRGDRLAWSDNVREIKEFIDVLRCQLEFLPVSCSSLMDPLTRHFAVAGIVALVRFWMVKRSLCRTVGTST